MFPLSNPRCRIAHNDNGRWALTGQKVKVLAGNRSDAVRTTAEAIHVTYVVEGVFIIDGALPRLELKSQVDLRSA